MENIDRYIKGDLSPEDMEKTTKILVEEQMLEEKRKVWAQELARTYKVHRDMPKMTNNRKMRRIWLRVAAAVLLILMSFPIYNTFFSSPSALVLADDLLENPFPNNELRKGEADIATLKIEAITAYNTKKYEAAITYYEEAITQGDTSETSYFFLGLSYLYQKNQDFDEAISNLELAQKASTNKYKEETNLFLSLALIKKGAQDQSRSILEKIVETKGWKYKDAEKLLQNLDDIYSSQNVTE